MDTNELLKAKHEIKLASGFLQDIVSGKKAFEIRKDDRDYQEGDFVLMKELSVIGGYSGNEVLVRIKYILRGMDAIRYGCNKGYCVWGFDIIALPLQSTKVDQEEDDEMEVWKDMLIEYDTLDKMEENGFEWNIKILMESYILTKK